MTSYIEFSLVQNLPMTPSSPNNLSKAKSQIDQFHGQPIMTYKTFAEKILSSSESTQPENDKKAEAPMRTSGGAFRSSRLRRFGQSTKRNLTTEELADILRPLDAAS